MAKGKKSKGNHYTSKGQHSNISRWSKLANRRDRKANPTPEQMHQSKEMIQRIISSPKNDTERKLKEKYLQKQKIENACRELLNTYEHAGLTRAEAIHAIKTDYVSTLKTKWNKKATIKKQQDEKSQSSAFSHLANH